MADKEVVMLKTQASDDTWGTWTPDIVVGIDFGMTYTGVFCLITSVNNYVCSFLRDDILISPSFYRGCIFMCTRMASPQNHSTLAGKVARRAFQQSSHMY